MSALALDYRPEFAAMMRADRDVKDRSYRKYPIGQEAGSFLRAKRVEGCALNTRKSYETTLRLFTLDHADFDALERFCEQGGADLLVAFLDDRWGDSEATTLDQRTKALNSFFAWAYETGRTSRPLKVKRRWVGERKLRVAHDYAVISEIAAAQPTLRDQVFVLLMGRLGLRKMEAGSLRVRDVDLAHDVVRLHSSKTGAAEVPITFSDLRDVLYLWLQEAKRNPNTYLFHPQGHPERAPNQSTVHRRFAQCLQRAGVSYFPMHELRHSAGHRLYERTGDVYAANQLLRHASLDMTKRYLHPSMDDLRARMRESE